MLFKYILLVLVSFSISSANEADVLFVNVTCHKKNTTCDFAVTIKHDDTGWKHYANAFEVITPDKKVLGKRILHHPHVKEQPFTRSLLRVSIPKGVNKVVVRAHDLVHKYGGDEVIVDLQRD